MKKFKLFIIAIILSSCFYSNESDLDVLHRIIGALTENWDLQDTHRIFKSINNYFNTMTVNLKTNKNIAIYSFNKNHWLKPLKTYDYHPIDTTNLLDIKYEDTCRLFYLNGKSTGININKIIILSKNKLNFLKKINGELAQSIQSVFMAKNFILYKTQFNIFPLKVGINPQVDQIYRDSLGHGTIKINITTMEAMIVKSFMEDQFMRQFNNKVYLLGLFLDGYNKSKQLFKDNKFFSLKKSLLENYKKSTNDFKYSSQVDHYIFDNEGNQWDGESKQQLMELNLNREILLLIYDNVY